MIKDDLVTCRLIVGEIKDCIEQIDELLYDSDDENISEVKELLEVIKRLL